MFSGNFNLLFLIFYRSSFGFLALCGGRP